VKMTHSQLDSQLRVIRFIRYSILASIWKQLAVPFLSSLTFLVAATAAKAEVIPFEALGYDQSVILRGVSPELNVGVPYPSGGVDPQNSFVRLRLEPSPRLSPDSTVRLLINGEIEQVVPVRTLLENPIVTIPLRALPPETRFINLAIQPYLYISRNYCQDLPTGNLFLTVGDDSFFQINPLRADQSVLGFFRPFYSQVVLNLPSNLNEQQAAAALALYSTLTYQFRDRKTPILWRQGSAPPAGSLAPTGRPNPAGANIAQSAAQSTTQNTAQVFFRAGTTGPDIQRNGSILEVRADQQAVEALMDLTNNPGLVSQGLGVEAIEQLEEQTLPLSRSFNVLGFRDGARRFFGTQTIDVPFSLAQLGGRPNDFVVNLRATWTPINLDLKERLTAQVYLNDTLVETYNLSETTKLDETLVLPATQLNSNNNLSVVTAYVPAEGNCLVSPTEMTFQLHGDSYFSWTGYQQPVGNFSDLPFLFGRQAGQVVADISQPDALAAAAYLVGTVTRIARQPLMPQLVDARQVQDWANLPREGNLPAWRLIVSPPEQTASLSAPVRLQDGFQIYNPTSQQRLLTVDPTEPLGILQYFSYQDKPTLWLSWWGGQPQTATRLAASLADPRTLLSAQLDGNVATYTTSTGIQSWDLRRRTLQVDYPEEFKLSVFLRRYRVPLTVLGLLLGAGIAWAIYRRLGQPPTPPAATSSPGPDEG
jgi:cellulose synthase operon protein B